MSAREHQTASPFTRNKSPSKYSPEEPNPSFLTQIKNKALPLPIKKKPVKKQERHALTARDLLGNKKSSPFQSEDPVTKEFMQDLGPIAKKIAGIIDLVDEEDMGTESLPFVHKTHLKKSKSLSRDQRLRAHVYSCMTSDVVAKLYSTYKEKQKEYIINKLKNSNSLNVNKLICLNINPNEKPEDYFLVKTIQSQGLTASQILNIEEIKTKEIKVASPKDEYEKELDMIIEKHKEQNGTKFLDKKEEEKQVIELSNIGTAISKHATQSQLHKIYRYFDKVDDIYERQEKIMKQAREERQKEIAVKFVRNDESIVQKIEEKAKAYVSKLCREQKIKTHGSGFYKPVMALNTRNFMSRETLVNPSLNQRSNHNSIEKPENSTNVDAIDLPPEPSTNPLVKMYYQGDILPRSKSVPKVLRGSDINSPTTVTATDTSFAQMNKKKPMEYLSPIKFKAPKRVKHKHNVSRESLDRVHGNGIESHELFFLEEKGFSTRSPPSTVFLQSSVNPEYSSPSMSMGRVSTNNERLMVMKKNSIGPSPLGHKTSMSSIKDIHTRSGSVSSIANKKLVKPLKELKEKMQAINVRNEEFALSSQRDKKNLEEKLTNLEKELNNFNEIGKTNVNTINLCSADKTTLFANQQNFKKEVVSKIVESIQNKEEALHSIQKKRFNVNMMPLAP